MAFDLLFGCACLSLFIVPVVKSTQKSFHVLWNEHRLASMPWGTSRFQSEGCKARSSMSAAALSEHASGGSLPLTRRQPSRKSPDVNKFKQVIKTNLLGFCLSQSAQTLMLMSGLFVPQTGRIHLIRLTSFINVLGISVMFRDIPKHWGEIKAATHGIKRRVAMQKYKVHCIQAEKSGEKGCPQEDSKAAMS